MADNPELLRIKENTKIQSNAKYHEDFEKNKGTYTVVADDPETRRVLENSKIISQVKYHEDFEKNIKNKYTTVIDNPETQRAIENQKLISSVEYKGIKNNNGHMNNNYSSNHNQFNHSNSNSNISQENGNRITQVATYKAGEKLIINDQDQRKIGSIADYDPVTFERKLINGHHNGTNGRSMTSSNSASQVYYQQQHHQPLQQVRGVSASNLNGNYTNGHSTNGYHTNGNGNGVGNGKMDHYYNNNNDNKYLNNEFIVNNINNLNNVKTSVYRAIYDYDAKEDDEISFRDGDKFINCEQIDVGWMIGVHEKTGKHGMFPANYAEPIDLF